MARSCFQLTAAVQQNIVAFIRAGGFPHVAAEAAGIPHEVFEQWRRQGEGSRAAKKYSDFALAIRQAVAQARLGAELSVRESKPLDWLRNGPGRETPERSGWTSLARPRSATAPATPLLLDPDAQALLANLLHALEAHPEARAAVAAFVTRNSDK
jgi:hypothetical protein